MRFGDFTAVDRVNFRIRRGEIFGFLGSNGCGKTTTMKMLTGLLPASEGEALLFGRAVRPSRPDRSSSRRLHDQGFSLYGELTVRRTWCCTRVFTACRKPTSRLGCRPWRTFRPRRHPGCTTRGIASG